MAEYFLLRESRQWPSGHAGNDVTASEQAQSPLKGLPVDDQ